MASPVWLFLRVCSPPGIGNRVKTDRRESWELANLSATRMLNQVWVPSEEDPDHLQVVRRRRQFVRDRVPGVLSSTLRLEVVGQTTQDHELVQI